MITITRSLARQLRAVFRRTGVGRIGHRVRVAFLATPATLHVRLKTQDIALEYRMTGQFQPEEFSLSYDFLADCEGRKDDPVTLQAQGKNRFLVSWSDRGVPQMARYDGESSGPSLEFPALPEQLHTIDPSIWSALADATQVADSDRIRYALDCLQLRGASGQIAATNGRHILIQRGFTFPWTDGVLIPASRVLGCPELAQHEFTLGKTDDWVALATGPWSVFLRIEKDAKYPKLDDLFRPAEQARSTLHLDPADAHFLVDALPRLPGGEDKDRPVTLDLSGHVAIRAADEEQTSVTELTLTNSRSSGETILVNTNRSFLLHAAQLGFREIGLFGPEVPIQCDDPRRQYLWAVLDAKSALQSGDNPICIASPLASGPAAPIPAATIPLPTTRQRSAMTRKRTPNQDPDLPAVPANPPATQAAENTKSPSPIEKAQALRDALRDALTKTNELITSLKRQRRQSKLVETTLSALEELRSAG